MPELAIDLATREGWLWLFYASAICLLGAVASRLVAGSLLDTSSAGCRRLIRGRLPPCVCHPPAFSGLTRPECRGKTAENCDFQANGRLAIGGRPD